MAQVNAATHISPPEPGIHPPYRSGSPESLRLDSLEAVMDSLAKDSLTIAPKKGIVMVNPEKDVVPEVVKKESSATSYVLVFLIALFCLIALRFRNNSRYIKVLFSELTEVRTRHNVFDETVRETLFLVLLNLLWCASAGVLIFTALEFLFPDIPSASTGVTVDPLAGYAVCMGIATLYTLFMNGVYLCVGNVFSDSVHTKLWVKGFAASQAICSFLFFPLALLCLCYPEARETLLLLSIFAYLPVKIIFLWKGFRIFFVRMSSWILFLYYLCSLEIVPLLLIYVLTLQICTSWL